MIIIIGGGPAGVFAAISARLSRPDVPVVILEKFNDLLRKVVVSGGGRCNVTNNCSDPRELAKFYPRGGRELISGFHHFGPSEVVQWFSDHNVPIKAEPDGRMFPESDSSSSIVGALLEATQRCGVEVRKRCGVVGVQFKPGQKKFILELNTGESLECDQVLIATGGQTSGDGLGGLDLATALGHGIISPVPSLFTFKIQDSLLEDLAGVAAQKVSIKALAPGLPSKGLVETGPVLVTHWGLSGPAVLRLSAWGARAMAEADYQFQVKIDWCPSLPRNELDGLLTSWADENGRKQVSQNPELGLPRRMWISLLEKSGIDRERKWAELGKKNRARLMDHLKATEMTVTGKALNKEEFVTCGGIKLEEVDFKTMESRITPGLFFAGEILDIDGITGGFNFQSCWTTGFLAGKGMSK